MWFFLRGDHRQVATPAGSKGGRLGRLPVVGIQDLAGNGVGHGVATDHFPGPSDLDACRVDLVADLDLLAHAAGWHTLCVNPFGQGGGLLTLIRILMQR